MSLCRVVCVCVQSVSLANKMLIPAFWLKSWLFGGCAIWCIIEPLCRRVALILDCGVVFR